MHFIEANCKIGMDQNVIAVILSPCELILVDSSQSYAYFTAKHFHTFFLLFWSLDTPDV